MGEKEGFYTIGLDFGSLSCRGVLADTADGTIMAEAEFVYPHGVIDTALPDGTKLPPLWALQDPQDYLDGLENTVRELLQKSGAAPERVLALGLDTTASTVIPVDRELRPLCLEERFQNRPHAWPKLWKHHAAIREAEQITELAKQMRLPVLEKYGGTVGAEFLLPKVLQVFHEDREVFEAAESFFELGDWLTSLLTGEEIRSGTALTCKSMWSPEEGYPPEAFFRSLHGELAELPRKKLAWHNGAKPGIVWPGERAGSLCLSMAERLGLAAGTVVTAPQMDAYAGLPGSGISGPGSLMMMIGTSTGYMLLGEEKKTVPGICASVENSILPGFMCYAAGQAGVGDIFGWFIKTCVPESYVRAASERGLSLHGYLTELALQSRPGENGLLALDWWNGNKSCLNNSCLSGLILGMDLRTKPEHIYRALLEATAFGARKIVENFEANGVPVKEIVACGGIAQKNTLLMQIYADVLGKPIKGNPVTQTAALGSAIYAAAAAKGTEGAHEDVFSAIHAMTGGSAKQYIPKTENSMVYSALYEEYIRLHDYFGTGGNAVMERLKTMRT